MRHLKSNTPFERIVFKNKRIRSKSTSNTAQQRSYSAKQRIPEGLTNQKIKEELEKVEEPKYETKNNFFSKDDKYANFKNEMMNEFNKDQMNVSGKKNASPSKSRRAQPKPEEQVKN
jgi:ketol-acid reductoisomerase